MDDRTFPRRRRAPPTASRIFPGCGRKHPAEHPWPSWMGYSVGKWDNDTLAVDTMGFNDRSWLDANGHPRSEAMHIVERFRRRDFGHMDLALTVDDPKMYTRPFTVK